MRTSLSRRGFFVTVGAALTAAHARTLWRPGLSAIRTSVSLDDINRVALAYCLPMVRKHFERDQTALYAYLRKGA